MDWIFPALALLGVIAVVVTTVVRTSRRDRLDPFHPLVFPVTYVAAATLLPVLWLTLGGEPLGFVTTDSLGPRTPLELSLAVVGFAGTAAIPFRRPEPTGAGADRSDGRLIWWAGVVLIAMPLVAAIVDVAQAAVLTRGAGQGDYTIGDTVRAAAFILAPTGAVLIGIGRTHQRRGFAALDWALILGLVALLGLNGRRGSALALILVALMFVALRHRVRLRTLLISAGAMVAFAYSVVVYRTIAVGNGGDTINPFVVVLRDLGAVTYVTGWTDKLASASAHGSTLLAAIVYQIPRPIAIHLAPDMETGAQRFRDVMHVADSQGFGYALPADGVLNFGVLGALLVPALFGLVYSWAYARWDATATKGLAWIYPVAVATLPFAWRSDVLGAVKGIAYPLVAFVVIAWIVRILNGRRERTLDATEHEASSTVL